VVGGERGLPLSSSISEEWTERLLRVRVRARERRKAAIGAFILMALDQSILSIAVVVAAVLLIVILSIEPL